MKIPMWAWIVLGILVLMITIMVIAKNAVKLVLDNVDIPSVFKGNPTINLTIKNIMPFDIKVKNMIVNIKIAGVTYYQYKNSEVTLPSGTSNLSVQFQKIKDADAGTLLSLTTGTKVQVEATGTILGFMNFTYSKNI